MEAKDLCAPKDISTPPSEEHVQPELFPLLGFKGIEEQQAFVLYKIESVKIILYKIESVQKENHNFVLCTFP